MTYAERESYMIPMAGRHQHTQALAFITHDDIKMAQMPPVSETNTADA